MNLLLKEVKEKDLTSKKFIKYKNVHDRRFVSKTSISRTRNKSFYI